MIIAIIGLDGSGKSTQARLLTERLNAAGVQVVCVRPIFIVKNNLVALDKTFGKASPRRARSREEGWYIGIGGRLKKLMLAVTGYSYVLITILYMRLILSRGKVVVCDRYFYQTIYDLWGRRAGALSRLTPCADLTFMLTMGLDAIRSRQTGGDRNLPEEYFAKVNDFLRIVSAQKGFTQINGVGDSNAISDIIFTHVIADARTRVNDG